MKADKTSSTIEHEFSLWHKIVEQDICYNFKAKRRLETSLNNLFDVFHHQAGHKHYLENKFR